MQLQYKTPNGHYCRHYSLPRVEEQKLADKGPQFVGDEMYRLILEVTQVRPAYLYRGHPEYFRANSLIWIWIQMKPNQVKANVRILMAQQGLESLAQLAKKMRMNGSFIWRTLSLTEPDHFGGWNMETVLALSDALSTRPELLLRADLSRMVAEEVTNWQI
jgi:hypothetical protein